MAFRCFPRLYKTLRGERVYSRGEKEVADHLFRHGFEYEYERRIRVGGLPKVPDFYLPRHDIYIEYLGMVRDPRSACAYRNKEAEYVRQGLDVIQLYPQHLPMLGLILVRRIGDHGRDPAKSAYVELSRRHAALARDRINTPHYPSRARGRVRPAMAARFRAIRSSLGRFLRPRWRMS